MKKAFQTLVLSSFLLMSLSGGVTIVMAQPAYAADDALSCAILPADICNMAKNNSTGAPNSQNNAVLKLLEWAIAILSAGVGVAAVGAFIYAGILYSSAGDKADQISKSKSIMTNTTIGLVAFATMALAIQWLIPGGVF